MLREKVVCKLRTNRDAFCRRNFEAMATWSVGGWRNICTQRGLIELINNVWRVTEIMGREKSQEKDWVF